MKDKDSANKNNKKNLIDETPKGDTPDGEIKVYEKIDPTKNLKDIIEENSKNFKEPSNDIQFIENQATLDYITSEKYKKEEINVDEFSKLGKKAGYSAVNDLLMFYNKKKCKVYIDDTIDSEFYSQLQKYYFSENILKKKIRIHLNISKDKLNDIKVVNDIITKIVKKISGITKIPIDNLHVTNVRRNCLLFEIFHLIRKNIERFIVGELNEEVIQRNRRELETFLRNIERELGNDNIIEENREIRFEIRKLIDHIVIRPNFHFNGRYNKARGDFGLRHFLIFPYHKEYVNKNGRRYYYPGERYQGFGLKVHCKDIDDIHYCCEDIFDPNGDWCIAYADLLKNRISYKVNNVHPEILYDNNHQGYRLLYQCKIKRTEIENVRDDIITLRHDNKDYVIPYRLLKENIEN